MGETQILKRDYTERKPLHQDRVQEDKLFQSFIKDLTVSIQSGHYVGSVVSIYTLQNNGPEVVHRSEQDTSWVVAVHPEMENLSSIHLIPARTLILLPPYERFEVAKERMIEEGYNVINDRDIGWIMASLPIYTSR